MMRINYLADYGPLAMRTEKPMPVNQRKMHALLGMITENGEFTTGVKRVVIYGKPLSNEMVSNMLEELGDWCWYAAIALDSLGAKFDLDQTFLPPHWNRKTLTDKLVYCGCQLNNIAAYFLMGMELATLNNSGIEDDQAQVASLKRAITTISMTIDALTDGNGSIFDVLSGNIDKLRNRFPEAYSDQAAEARADKGGLSALES